MQSILLYLIIKINSSAWHWPELTHTCKPVDIYKVFISGRALSGHSFYAVEDRVMCEGCYVNTLEKCNECKLPVTDRILRATGERLH